MTINQSANLAFSLPPGDGTFTGNLIQGELVGSHSSNGGSASVRVNSVGITVDGDNFPCDQFAD